MTDERTATLGAVFGDVLARLAFMFGEPAAPAALPEPPPPVLLAQMEFHGPRSGSLALATAASLADELAANVLGVEPGDAAAAAGAGDALGELLNVTCGHVLTALAGEGPVFDLSAPTGSRLDAAGWRALREDPDAAGFVVEGRPVLLRLRLGD